MTWEIIEGDAENILKDIKDDSVDCIFTSPYPIRSSADMWKIISILGFGCRRILKPTGSMWVHMEDSYNDKGSLMRWPALFSLEMISSCEWILRAERIWHIPVGDSDFYNEGKVIDNNRLILDHCYVFHFTQSRYGYYNNFVDMKGQPCSIFTDKLEKLDPQGFATGFSKELVKQSLLMSCPQGGTVLDPFVGSGTTGVVALAMKDKDYSFTGIEIVPDKIEPLKERLANVFSY